ncbi:MAG: hypothetical protein IJF71_05640 [Clostridia bacterium]|nr:hypothetical protein [Clostridia bacterium]
MVQKELITFYGFENCVRICNGDAELIVATEVPYILSYRREGGENLMHLDPSLAGVRSPEKWVNYGGARLWTSPEVKGRADEPDSFPVDYELTEGGVILTQKTMSAACTKKTVEIEMAESGTKVYLNYRIENRNLFEITISAWALAVLRSGGVNCVKQIDVDTGLLPNRSLILWPYTRLNDPRLTFTDHFIKIRSVKGAPSPLKVGMPLFDGAAAYFTDGEVFVKRFPGLAEEELYPFEDTPAYPDCSCNFECYTNGEMLESESLSPLMPIKTGEVVEHEEEWEIFVANEPTTEEELSAFFDANVL